MVQIRRTNDYAQCATLRTRLGIVVREGMTKTELLAKLEDHYDHAGGQEEAKRAVK
jgi:hypothetical protein